MSLYEGLEDDKDKTDPKSDLCKLNLQRPSFGVEIISACLTAESTLLIVLCFVPNLCFGWRLKFAKTDFVLFFVQLDGAQCTRCWQYRNSCRPKAKQVSTNPR